MKARYFLMFVLTLMLTAGLLQADEEAVEELSNTNYAEVELRITTDPKVLSYDSVSDMLFFPTPNGKGPKTFPGVLEASNDILGQLNWQSILRVNEIGYMRIVSGMHTARLKLTVSLNDEYRQAAKEFLEAYIHNLEVQLKKEYEFGREIYAGKFGQYQKQREETEMQLRGLLKQQNKLSGGRGPLDKESVRLRIYEHEQKIIENSIQREILMRRAAMLSKSIGQFDENENAKAAIGEDPIIRQMKERLQQQKTKLESMVKKLESIAERERETLELRNQIAETRTLIAKSETDLGLRQQEIEEVFSHEVDRLKQQLRETTVQLEELTIESDILQGSGPGSLSDSEQYEILEVQIQAARENLHRAIVEADAFRAQIGQIMPPKVSYDEIMALETSPKEDN